MEGGWLCGCGYWISTILYHPLYATSADLLTFEIFVYLKKEEAVKNNMTLEIQDGIKIFF